MHFSQKGGYIILFVFIFEHTVIKIFKNYLNKETRTFQNYLPYAGTVVSQSWDRIVRSHFAHLQ